MYRPIVEPQKVFATFSNELAEFNENFFFINKDRLSFKYPRLELEKIDGNS